LKAAAARVLADKGFYAMQMSDICKSVGLSQGAIYKYFANKAEITAEVFTEFLSLIRDRVKSLETEGDEYSKIYQATLLWVTVFSNNVGLVRTLRQLSYEDGSFAEIPHSHSSLWGHEMVGYISRGPGSDSRQKAVDLALSWSYIGLTIYFLDEVYVRGNSFAGMAGSAEKAAETIAILWYRQVFAENPPPHHVDRNHPVLAALEKRSSK
jgi:AcrR family transcriptional regulator